ncbi:MAG: hypothetical protein ABI564_06840 [Ideonella sp.]
MDQIPRLFCRPSEDGLKPSIVNAALLVAALTGCIGSSPGLHGDAMRTVGSDYGIANAAASTSTSTNSGNATPEAWPAPRAPFDTTLITPVESTGAPAAE